MKFVLHDEGTEFLHRSTMCKLFGGGKGFRSGLVEAPELSSAHVKVERVRKGYKNSRLPQVVSSRFGLSSLAAPTL
jgi:hypothetical protein